MISLGEVMLTVQKQLLVVFEALTAGIEGRRMFFSPDAPKHVHPL